MHVVWWSFLGHLRSAGVSEDLVTKAESLSWVLQLTSSSIVFSVCVSHIEALEAAPLNPPILGAWCFADLAHDATPALHHHDTSQGLKKVEFNPKPYTLNPKTLNPKP